MYITIDTEVDIDIDDVLSALSRKEKEELLVELSNELCSNINVLDIMSDSLSVQTKSISENLAKIMRNSWRLSLDEELIIASIADKL